MYSPELYLQNASAIARVVETKIAEVGQPIAMQKSESFVMNRTAEELANVERPAELPLGELPESSDDEVQSSSFNDSCPTGSLSAERSLDFLIGD